MYLQGSRRTNMSGKESIKFITQFKEWEDCTAKKIKMKVWRKGNKKSLGILCESFIKQFLYWRATITLEQAARRISDKIDESKLKTKVRRLYDIANVLAALNLIEKTSLETRKPAFKWVGESGLQLFIEEMENVLKVQNNEIFISNEFCDSKVALFEFKSENYFYFCSLLYKIYF